MLESIGEDPNRPGLVDTPKRVARMYEELAAGYEEDVTKHLSKTFPAQNSEIVIEKDILFYSLCEHHLLPFFGKVHIAYVPNEKVVGISKLARTVEVYARRLQIQEQMTTQIADALTNHLCTKGVMVMIEAEHMCMTMRGIKKEGSKTVTFATRGCFCEDQELREASVYKGYKRDEIEMRGDRAEMSDFPLYLNTVAGGLDCRNQAIGGFSFVVKIYALPVVEIIGQILYLLGRYGFDAQIGYCF